MLCHSSGSHLENTAARQWQNEHLSPSRSHQPNGNHLLYKPLNSQHDVGEAKAKSKDDTIGNVNIFLRYIINL